MKKNKKSVFKQHEKHISGVSYWARTTMIGSSAVLCLFMAPSVQADPVIDMKKFVSLTGREPFFNANDCNDPLAAVLGADCTYLLRVRNDGRDSG